MLGYKYIVFRLVAVLAAVIRISSQEIAKQTNKCEDTIDEDDCEFMRDNGWCEEDIDYLKRKCDFTCGWCSESEECVDRANYLPCKKLTKKECNSNIEFYSTRCRKSCGFCSGLPEGIWGGWSSWSQCDETCDPGFHTRFRRCLTKNCQGDSSEVDVCLVKRCPTWSPWTDWGACSVSCGQGVKKRNRTCSQGDECQGISEESVECATRPCPEWSPCSRSCGGGTKTTLCTDVPDTCRKLYEDCNTHRCPYKSCDEYRYGSDSSACCNDEEDDCVRASRRVIGGTISKPKQFAWMARIEVKGGPLPKNVIRLQCGGTLIHPEHVLTAAHCLENVTPVRLEVLFGAISKFDASSRTQRILVSNFTLHPNYSYPLNDIAMMKLKTKATMTSYVSLLSLPQGEETALDKKCFIAGWGYTNSQWKSASHNLLEAKVRHLPFDICDQAYSENMDEKTMMCAGIIAGGVDTCGGDSGGPLMCQRCSSCSWYIAGLTSFGADNCGVAYRPGVYTRVVPYEDWIESFYAK